MPVQYRQFYFRKLIAVKEKEKSDMDKAQGKMSGAVPESPVVKGPGVMPRR